MAHTYAQAPRFADRLEAAVSLFAGSIFCLSISLPPSAVPWHAALARFCAAIRTSRKDRVFWLIYGSQAV